MIKRSLESMASTWLAGLFLLLPLALTVAVVVWIASIASSAQGLSLAGCSRRWAIRLPRIRGSPTCLARSC